MKLRSFGDFVLNLALATLVLLPFIFIFWHSISGDSSIYFTFIKNFFKLPFSYQPDTVSFGATSPLLVIIYAPIYTIFGANQWLLAGKAINLFLIAIGITVLNRSVKGDIFTLLLICVLTTLNRQLFITTAQLYETSLAFLLMALLFYTVSHKQLIWASIVSGLLYLVRPELVIVTAAISLFTIWKIWFDGRSYIRILTVLFLSTFPTFIYHLYMLLATGEYLPSSVYARAIRPLELGLSWSMKLSTSLQTLQGVDGLIFLIGGLCFVFIIMSKNIKHFQVELLMLTPALLYIVFPPVSYYYIRYMLPITPAIIVIVVKVTRIIMHSTANSLNALPVKIRSIPFFQSKYFSNYLGVIPILFLISLVSYYLPYYRSPLYEYDTLLLKDLAQELNPLVTKEDQVLIYEIQGQYYIDGQCLSLDGIVGRQLLDALQGTQSFESFIVTHQKVKYIVTSNSFNYRKVYAGTLLERLYVHDLDSKINDVTEINGVVLQKILTNPAFSDLSYYTEIPDSPLNVGGTMRVYSENNKLWAGQSPIWNSVYKVLR